MSQKKQHPRRAPLTGLVFFLSALGLAGCQLPLPGFAPPPPPPQNAARPYFGEVVDVVSGDTLRVRRDGQQTATTVRLAGVHAPQPGERLGARAKQCAQTLLSGQRVQVVPAPTQSVALVSPSQTPGRYLNRELVRDGLAWTNEGFPASIGAVAQDMVNDESRAKQARRGLWFDPAFQSPKERRWLKQRPAAGKEANP